LIHELGHAAGVIWLKGRVLMLAVGPIAAQFGPFKLGSAPSLGRDRREVGGFVLATFDGYETTRKDLIVAAAGPVANLLFAAVLGLLLAVLAPATAPQSSVPAIAVQKNATVNAPFRVALPSDADVVRVLRDERAKRQYKHIWSPLIIALIILSLAAGVANLTPYPGSDGDEIRRAIRDMMEARRYRARRDAR
jgi:Zn-dependent protease